MAEPSLIGVIDSYGIELLHPVREGRSGNKSDVKENPIIAGLLGANSAMCSIISV
ncbi:MAG: hypothetical protein U0175_05470 [Caldilineaceae bacterium]